MISIVIPAYNSELTIARTVDSIIRQSYSNWELLIINDGSKDRTEEICDIYVGKDKRIKLYNQENKGVSAARNLGIKKAQGDLLVFIDADDEVLDCYLGDMINEYIKFGYPDLVIQGHIKMNKNRKPKVECNNSAVYSLFDDKKFFQEFNILKCGFSWTKLFIRNIIVKNKLSFDISLKFCEDLVFVMNYLLYCNLVYISEKNNYIYHYTNNSLSTSYHNFNCEYKSYNEIVNNYINLLKVKNVQEDLINILLEKNYSAAILRPIFSIVLMKKVSLSYKKKLIYSLDNTYFDILRSLFRRKKGYRVICPIINKQFWFFLLVIFYCKHVVSG